MDSAKFTQAPPAPRTFPEQIGVPDLDARGKRGVRKQRRRT